MNENQQNQRLTEAVRAVLRGDTDAYGIIVTELMGKMYAKALSLCRSRAEAEDLVQETFIDGYFHLSELREQDKIEGWLMRILRNKTLNYITRSRKNESIDSLHEIADSRSPEALIISRESLRELKEKLSLLSPALRQTAELYFIYGLSMEKIAAATSLPLGTVKRRIHDARKKLKKENFMQNETNIVPDRFAEALAVKIKELADYTQTYGHTGFDSAYSNVKELIAGLSDCENIKKYSVQSAAIAAQADMDKYAEEALATYKKYGDALNASWLYLDLCWKKDDKKERIAYTKETILPALAGYPESEIRNHEIACHNFWTADYIDKSTPEGLAEAQEYLDKAMAGYKTDTLVDAMHANTIAALKGMECLRDGRDMQQLVVTGETWAVRGGNLYYFNQPGCNYADSSLWKYQNYIYSYAGYEGDRYFFPRSIPLEAGAEEKMLGTNGEYAGTRTVAAVDETVVTPAGTFENCLHLRKTDAQGSSHDTWYKYGVGLVKSASDSATETKVLSSYEIRSGDGWLPLAVGNRWCYETPDKPEALSERNEYVIEQMGTYYSPDQTKSLMNDDSGDEDITAVSVSCLNYFALEKNWRETTTDAALLFAYAGQLCGEKKYPEAADVLRSIVIANKKRESVDAALELLRYLEEKLPLDKKNWRFCPSSANISTVEMKNGAIVYAESVYESLDTGVWGSRNPEDRIFGVKPFRYLSQLCGTLWSDRWVPGYTEERAHPWDEGVKIRISVDEGGRVETPAGAFDDTVHVTVDCGDCSNPEYFFYFYNNTHHGRKEFWFARGVGLVRFKCTWGEQLSSDAPLTKYHVISDGEMLPIHIGNSWQYDEVTLTSENYIARREYKVISGMSGRYLLGDHQFFTWKGSVDEYEAWKKTTAK